MSVEVLIAYVKTPNLARNKDSETAAGESTGVKKRSFDAVCMQGRRNGF